MNKNTQITTETIPKTKQKKETPLKSKLNNRELAFALLLKQGLPIAKASELAGYHPTYGYQVEKKLKKSKYDLTSDKWLGKAERVLGNILDAKTWGSVEKIKDSTALTACQMVYDRAQPIVHRNESVNVNAKIDLVDLSKYKREGVVNVDVEPTPSEI